MKCPSCDADCDRDDVDIGVGTIYGPWRCLSCGWCQPLAVTPEMLVSDATYETYTPTSEDGAIIGELLASRLASSESEPIAAFTRGRVVPNSDDPDSEGSD